MATVLNRTTKELITSANTPDFDPEEWIINPDLSSVSGISINCWVIEGDTVREMTDEEKDTCILSALKTSRYAEIDAKTDELISSGFIWPSGTDNVFELSLEAQSRMNALLVLAEHPAMEYPIEWNTKDDDDSITISGSDDALSLCLTAVGTYRAVIDSGTTLKNSIRNAITVSGVNTITDPR